METRFFALFLHVCEMIWLLLYYFIHSWYSRMIWMRSRECNMWKWNWDRMLEYCTLFDSLIIDVRTLIPNWNPLCNIHYTYILLYIYIYRGTKRKLIRCNHVWLYISYEMSIAQYSFFVVCRCKELTKTFSELAIFNMDYYFYLYFRAHTIIIMIVIFLMRLYM